MIKSFSKINLFLKVLKKNQSGLHNIQSSVMLIDLYDRIRIQNTNKKKDEIKFIGQFKNKINSKNNSITKSLKILRKYHLINKKKKFKIVVEKRIPVFAGLGGGTSNAAYLIKYFLKKKVTQNFLKVFEEAVGSDFRLFSHNQSFQKNLKKILKFKKRYNFYFILVYPNIQCSTKQIYSKVVNFNSPLKNDISKIENKSKYVQFLQNEKNDLQSIVEKKHGKIKKILALIKAQKKSLFSRMTGSGSVCFGVFPDKKSANLSLQAIKKKLPNYWCAMAKSI